MNSKLSEKELKVLLYIEHEDGGLIPPEGMSVAGYATACDGLKAWGYANPEYIEGHNVGSVHITPDGLSFLEDWREDEAKKKDELERLRAENEILKKCLDKSDDDSSSTERSDNFNEVLYPQMTIPQQDVIIKDESSFKYDEQSETMYIYEFSAGRTTGRKKGRPIAKDFEEYVKESAPQGFMSVLEQMLEGKNGKEAYSIILAAQDHWINEPSIASVCEKFKSITKSSYESARSRHLGINRYQNKGTSIEQAELESIRNEIRRKLSLLCENT